MEEHPEHIDDLESTNDEENLNSQTEIKPVGGLFKDWFVEYASYVILERAIPAVEDGLKPVQRRILHAMNVMDDGRFNKVANIIGATMAYHPHGDAAIGDALVNLGQKDLLIETQGNWGDVRTGDSAAAPRYIEARLSKFAKEVAFNDKTTEWQLSYDGRKREPINLPMKFPLVLAQGVEGIAVGLSTKIMPHNFLELCEASIDVLKGKKVQIFPDFPTGGSADFTHYNDGKKGSRIRVRARIEEKDKNTLLVKDIPFGTTTGSLIESIIKASDSGKIKVKRVIDNTAANVEIEIQLAPGILPDMAINALYAFTDCELSISPLACIIEADRPSFMGVSEILKASTFHTLGLLRRELEIQLDELENKWHYSSLEKIFIENRIYRDIEECETWEAVIETIDRGLDPFKPLLKREVLEEDIIRLTEIKIKRISKFDSFKADELIRSVENEITEVRHHLEHLTDYAIVYFKQLIKKYGAGKERKTEIKVFDTIEANIVAAANVKLYANYEEGFVGTSLRKDTFVLDCSDIDDVIAFRADGSYSIAKVSDKHFFGKELIHVGIWRKGDERTTYNLVYWDGAGKKAMAKRFNATGLIREKVYNMATENPKTKVLYFSVNPNGEAEKINIYLSASANARLKQFDYDFAKLAIKGKTAGGNQITKYPVRKVDLKEKGGSTLGGVNIWWDNLTGRLNGDEKGVYLGDFNADDQLLVIYKDGSYELTNYELINRFAPEEVYHIQKFYAELPLQVVYLDGKSKQHFVKRFVIETSTSNKKFVFISEEKGSLLECLSLANPMTIELLSENKKKEKNTEEINITEFIEVKGWKAVGNRLSFDTVKKITMTSDKSGVPEPVIQEESVEDEVDANDESNGSAPAAPIIRDIEPPKTNGDSPQLNLL
jgi:topoisomerase IV subunit A